MALKDTVRGRHSVLGPYFTSLAVFVHIACELIPGTLSPKILAERRDCASMDGSKLEKNNWSKNKRTQGQRRQPNLRFVKKKERSLTDTDKSSSSSVAFHACL